MHHLKNFVLTMQQWLPGQELEKLRNKKRRQIRYYTAAEMEFGFVMKSIAIIGSGNWAEALSKILKPTKLIIKCRSIKKQKGNFNSSKISITDNFNDINGSEIIFIAIPSQTIRENLMSLKKTKKKS